LPIMRKKVWTLACGSSVVHSVAWTSLGGFTVGSSRLSENVTVLSQDL